MYRISLSHATDHIFSWLTVAASRREAFLEALDSPYMTNGITTIKVEAI